MSIRRISFGPLALSSPSDKLSLNVEYEVAVRLPSGKLEALPIGECLDALSSGEVWVSRGNSCRIEFNITLDGKALVDNDNDHIIELLGRFIAGSKIWTQLGLSTILHLQDAVLQKGTISLHLNHKEPSSLPVAASRPWSNTTTDIRTPEALLCAQMEQLKVCLAFTSTSPGHQSSKRIKASPWNLVIGENSSKPLKITQPDTPTKSPIVKFGPSEKLSELLKECSNDLYSSLVLHAIPALSQLSSSISSGLFSISISTSRHTISSTASRKKSRAKSPNTDMSVLKELESDSVPSIDAAIDDMLLLSAGDEEDSTQLPKNDSSSSLTIKTLPRKRDASAINHESDAYVLNPTASCNLVSAAMRLMIAGAETRERTIKGVKVYSTSDTSATSLASLSPVMFSPGFKKSVADNSRYIPRIIQMMTSLSRNAHTPSLKQKLAQIANMPSCEFPNDRNDEKINGELGSEKRLAAVVQARVWSMMQRTLHDPLAARQATNKRSAFENAVTIEDDDGYDDLLETIGTENELRILKTDDDFRWIIDESHSEESTFGCILDKFDETSEDEFDDLLDDEDEILLDDERERLTIESETEEIFFGRRWQLEDEEQDDDLLLVVEGSIENELLLEDRGGIARAAAS
ncbi:hypothetical protein SBOR_2489 [Sclerotinia borealis F-4128]|uniref:Uncharacterized protein n=1 Tax=Sclerotinia borealis (strain F-4128) TaxID=1432307 RepID=W9CMQ2_SCLBF|nr:hypothetical protein SBOR_2489 [Sclerotinia borealis F-4128]